MTTRQSSWRPPQFIRPIAIAFVRRRDELLVMAVREDEGRLKGWRPPGGGIDFGEIALDTIQREFVEEFGLKLTDLKLVTILENIFVHAGTPGHEIVYVFDAAFDDPAGYAQDEFRFVDGQAVNECRWVAIAEFASGKEQLFPLGVLAHLDRTWCQAPPVPGTQ